jgi:hypothetical protein
MFPGSFVAITLFTSLLSAADASKPNVFTVRSSTAPEPDKKIPITGQLLSSADPKKTEKCAIPLLEMKAGKTGDHIGIPVGKVNDPLVIVPPVPVCKDWNQGQNISAPSSIIRLH